MKKICYLIIMLFAFGCNTEDASDCFKATGEIVREEVEMPFFDKVNIFGHINLIIEQGSEQQVLVEAGENFIEDVEFVVVDGELRVTEKNNCNLFREYGTTNVFITVSNLKRIQNSSSGTIESVGLLQFPELSLISENQANDSDVYTNGVFILNVESEKIGITSDNISKFFLSGTTVLFKPGFYGGDGRLEAANLIAERVDLFHRGSNEMIVNPQQAISGEIRSTGDVVSVNVPPLVAVESFYTGRLIFE